MKIMFVIAVIVGLCLTASAKPTSVGGDFGRAWISNYLAKNPSHVSQEDNSSGNWGNAPKVQGTINSNMVSQQDTTNLIKPSSNWLGDTANLGNPSSQNFTQVPFFIGGGLKPIHAMDASWNHTAPIPQPDANGLTHGWMPKRTTLLGRSLIISKLFRM